MLSVGLVENALGELGLRQAVSPEAATSVAVDDVESEYLLAGRVEQLSARSDADQARLRAVFLPVGSPDKAVHLSADVLHGHTAKADSWSAESYPWPARLLAWLALVVLLPLAVAPLALWGLQRGSNAVNLAMLLGLTLLAALAAFAMIGFRLDSWLSAALLIAAAGGWLAYNWGGLVKLEKLDA